MRVRQVCEPHGPVVYITYHIVNNKCHIHLAVIRLIKWHSDTITKSSYSSWRMRRSNASKEIHISGLIYWNAQKWE